MAEKKYKYNVKDRDYFFSKFQDFLNERVEIYPGKFLPELQRFLDGQIKKGNIKGITEDDTENVAAVLMKTLKEI